MITRMSARGLITNRDHELLFNAALGGVRGEAMEVDVEDGAPRDESSMDAGPNGVAGLLAEEADDDMVADPRTDE